MKLFIIATVVLISNIAFADSEALVQPNCPDGKKIAGAACPVATSSPGNILSSAGVLTRGSSPATSDGSK